MWLRGILRKARKCRVFVFMIFRLLKKYKKESILAPLFKMLEAGFELFVPLVIAQLIDGGIGKNDSGVVVRCTLTLFCLAAIGLLCSVRAQYYAAKAAIGAAAALRSLLFKKLESFSFLKLETLGTDTMITRLTSDVNQVQNGVNMTLRLFLRSPFIVLGAVVMSFTIDARCAMIFAVTVPVLSVIVYGIMLITIPMYKKVQSLLDRVLAVSRENLDGVRVIRAFGMEEDERVSFDEKNEALNHMQKFAGRISALMNPLTFVVVNCATLLLLYTGAVKVDTGVLTRGQVVALVNYMSQILVELVKLANLIILLTRAFACEARIEAVLAESSDEQEVFEQEEPFEPDEKFDQGEMSGTGEAASGKRHKSEKRHNSDKRHNSGKQHDSNKRHTNEKKHASGKKPAAAAKDSKEGALIEFRDVSFSYHEGAEKALSDISFTARPGEIIGIIGGTGSGKSTLAGMIPGFFFPTEGDVLIEGKPSSEHSLEELRSMTGIALQQALIFTGTIRENLLWGSPEASDEELRRALMTAQAWDFVEKRPGALDASLKQGGRDLSGGQKQRLNIARAIAGDPRIIILDDSSSALDYATDSALRSALRELSDRYSPTIFIISQRTASVRSADRIIVLEEGRMVGDGDHDSLMESCPQYREIHESQSR